MKREWLAELRIKKNLTQPEIAKLCNISQQFYSFIELGIRRPSVQVAKRIAKLLKFKWTKFYE